MKCPHCNEPVGPQQSRCGMCGFSAISLHGYLGNQWVKLERITDAAQGLRLEDKRRLEVTLDDFERSFPQVFFATYLGVLPNNVSAAELGFWLLNQGAFNTPSIIRRNDFGIILVVDPAMRTVCLTLGYAIEKWIPPKTIQQILQATGKHLAHGAFGTAIEQACLLCATSLKKNARKVDWEPAQPGLPSGSPDMGLTLLRGNHRPASRPLAGLSQNAR
ncbi:MAG: TPM domain-containing protein [Verrucomicrobiaceae bacterium]|nr:TPM domain-containing protein [Verrucomicrobiaceae bacterium]